MKKSTRIILAFAIILLIPLYFLPIWKIDLDAPQFPEGISMHIYIDKIGGSDPYTLENVNILNHYIGMREINPDDIPELIYMPYILGFLIVFGLATLLTNKRWMLYAWISLLLIAAVLAFYDFYLWEYDYGHNLDPNAPIKIPGMAYQPPLIGKKEMLNITAYSLPHTGGWFLVGSIFLIIIAVVNEFKSSFGKRGA